MRYGLLGETLSHSHSPAIHAQLAPYRYELFPMPPDEVGTFLRLPDIGGLNVTIPYKEKVLPLCDDVSAQAAQIGSVNTLVYDEKRRITGHNTDYAGFLAMAGRAGISFAGQKVVVLGSGGTSRTAVQAARDQGAREVVVVSRHGQSNYENLHIHRDADVLVNTTPVGMFPQVDAQPVSLDVFDHLSGVVDVVYNPLRTRLVLDALARGIPATGGLSMLVYQAAEAAALFCRKPVNRQQADRVLTDIRASLENIVLIGMPGCGKSSVGRALAALSGRELVDTDDEIVRMAGKPIPAIFEQGGEAAFRALEKEAVQGAAARHGVIIATGGGSVMFPENRTALSQNGRVFFLQRPLEMLAVAGRPLSVNLHEMASRRMPVYQSFCDASVENNGPVDAVARQIWEVFE